MGTVWEKATQSPTCIWRRTMGYPHSYLTGNLAIVRASMRGAPTKVSRYLKKNTIVNEIFISNSFRGCLASIQVFSQKQILCNTIFIVARDLLSWVVVMKNYPHTIHYVYIGSISPLTRLLSREKCQSLLTVVHLSSSPKAQMMALSMATGGVVPARWPTSTHPLWSTQALLDSAYVLCHLCPRLTVLKYQI